MCLHAPRINFWILSGMLRRLIEELAVQRRRNEHLVCWSIYWRQLPKSFLTFSSHELLGKHVMDCQLRFDVSDKGRERARLCLAPASRTLRIQQAAQAFHNRLVSILHERKVIR